MTRQDHLVEILKHKGIGPNGSKTLNNEDIAQVASLIGDEKCENTTKSTLLTALLLLDKSSEEVELIDSMKSNLSSIPKVLHFLLNGKSDKYRENLILRLINRENLNKEEADEAITSFFDINCPPYLTAAFLEGERLKRETDIENIAFYNYYLDNTKRIEIGNDPIIEIGDSFDGVKRNNNYNLFTCCVLASMGYKVTISGNETVAPKFGNTHHQILKQGGKQPLLTQDQVKNQFIENGWCYIDQSLMHENMWNNSTMRKHMVKRPFIATFEKIVSPITSSGGNYIITSYTHAHYQNANIEILKNNPFCKKAINIKGLEGTIQPKANISTIAMTLETDRSVNEYKHKFLGDIKSDTEISIEETLKQGISFLKHNTDNDAKNYVINTCVIILKKFKLIIDDKMILEEIEQVISTGKAYKNWQNSHQK